MMKLLKIKWEVKYWTGDWCRGSYYTDPIFVAAVDEACADI